MVVSATFRSPCGTPSRFGGAKGCYRQESPAGCPRISPVWRLLAHVDCRTPARFLSTDFPVRWQPQPRPRPETQRVHRLGADTLWPVGLATPCVRAPVHVAI